MSRYLPTPPPTKAQKVLKGKSFHASLLTAAVAGACGLALSQTAFASGQYLQTPHDLGDLSVVQISRTQETSSKSDAVVFDTLIQQDFSGALNANAQFGADDFNAVRATSGFKDFGILDGGHIDVSYVNGALLFSNSAEAISVENASITANASGIEGRPYIEVAGVTQYDGAIAFSGETTTISASSSLQIDEDEESVVYGYEIENPLGEADHKRTATFSADKTTISASSTGSNGVGTIGVYLAADATDNPEITFASGETSVSSTNETADQWAYGVFMHYSDGNEGTRGTISVAEDASLSITAKGGEAVGIFADYGTFTSNGTLTINAQGTGTELAAGIYAAGNATLKFNGKTDVTATGNEAYALYVKYLEETPDGQQTSDDVHEYPTRENFDVNFGENSITTLNGAVFVDKNMRVTLNGTMTVNGDFDLKGTLSGAGDLTINGQKSEYGAVMEGGFIREGASINVGNLTFLNGDFQNLGTIDATGNITIGSGATYKDNGDINAKGAIIVAQGGTYQSLYEDDGTTMFHDNGRVILEGGRVLNHAGNAFNAWEIETSKEGDYSDDAILEIAAGEYALDAVEVGANSGLEVTGGSLTLKNLTVSGDAAVTGGTLTVSEKITDQAGTINVANNGTFATNTNAVGFKTVDGADGFELSTDFKPVEVEAGGTMRVEGFDGVELSITQLANLKEALAGKDSEGLLDLAGDIKITGLTINGNEITATEANKLDNVTTDAIKAATVTEVTAKGVTGSYKAVKLNENVESLNVTEGALTLNGSAEGGNLVSASTGEVADIVVTGKVATIGNAEAANKGTVDGLTLNESATVNVVGTEEAAFTLGTVTTAESATGTNTVNVLGAKAEADEIGGEVDVNVGNSDRAGHVEVAKLTTSGLIFLDPAWKGDDEISDGSFLTAEDVDAEGKLNAKIVVGQNSTVAIGATKTEAVESFAQTGLEYGQNDVTAVFYAKKALTLADTGAIRVNGELTEAPEETSVAGGSFKVAKNGLVMVDSAAIDGEAPAITAKTITFEDGSHIRVVNLTKNSAGTLMAATEEGGLDIADSVIEDAKSTSAMVSLNLTSNEDGTLGFTTTLNSADDVFEGFEGNSFMDALYQAGANDVDAKDRGTRFLSRMAEFARYGVGSAAEAVDIGNQAMALAATAGVYNVALDASKLMNRSVDGRMSIANGLVRGEGATVWADVLATTNEAKSLYGDSGYDVDLYGGVLGADVGLGNGKVIGAALTVGTGDGGSKDAALDVDNDADFVGLSVYGSHRLGDFNGKVDIGWMHTKSDLSATAFGMKLDDEVSADAWTVGIGGEYLFEVGSINVVPHAGIRWTRLDVDGYTGAFKTDDDTMDIFTLPIGVAFSGNINAGSWKVAPMVDLSIVPSFGDDDATSKIRWQGLTETIKTKVVDDAPFQASLGVNAQNGNWTIGASYDLGIGGDDRLDNALTIRARYAF